MYILFIEDNPADVYLVRLALREARQSFELGVIEDGEEALCFVQRMGQESALPRPSLILLDLNLPRRDGIEVLHAIRESAELSNTPVAVLTSSDAAEDRARATAGGADRYILKPSRLEGYATVAKTICELCASS